MHTVGTDGYGSITSSGLRGLCHTIAVLSLNRLQGLLFANCTALALGKQVTQPLPYYSLKLWSYSLKIKRLIFKKVNFILNAKVELAFCFTKSAVAGCSISPLCNVLPSCVSKHHRKFKIFQCCRGLKPHSSLDCLQPHRNCTGAWHLVNSQPSRLIPIIPKQAYVSLAEVTLGCHETVLNRKCFHICNVAAYRLSVFLQI